MPHFVLSAYALGGACFAILLSGNADDAFCAEHPRVASLLAAGIPAALVSAFLCEVEEHRRTSWGAALACVAGLFVAGLAVASYFWVQNEHVRNGFLFGLILLAAPLWRYRKGWRFGRCFAAGPTSLPSSANRGAPRTRKDDLPGPGAMWWTA